MSNFIDNPFTSKSMLFHGDENIELEQNNISKYYQHMYLLVKKNNITVPVEFYNYMVPKDIFEQVSTNLIIHKVSIKMLKKKKHFDSIIMLSDEQLKQYNIFNYELSSKNIVLPILNIEYTNLLKYVEQFESSNNLPSVYKLMVLNNYFGQPNGNYIEMILMNLDESLWWTKVYNCYMNNTKNFKDRELSTQHTYIKNKLLATVIKDIHSNKAKSHIDTSVDYIDEIPTEKCNFSKLPSKSEFTRDEINMLFNTLNEKERFLLYANLMLSPKYCHLVVNNEYVQKMMLDTELKFAQLFRYIKSYAFISLYKREMIKKSYIKKDDESIFTIGAANLLPVYPFNHSKPKENPYMPICVSDHALKPSDNFCSIPYYGNFEGITGEGICSFDEFKKRMNIFTTNNMENDLFENIDFDKLDVCVTGGIMAACLQKKHPLLSRFMSKNETERYINYFNEYYPNSDIDIMFKAKDNIEFIDKVNTFYNSIILNVCKFNSNVDPQHIKLELNKVGYLFVTEEFITTNIDMTQLPEQTMQYIENNINNDNVKILFKSYYEKLAMEYHETLSATEKKEYPDIAKIENIDFKVYIKKNIKTNASLDTIDSIDMTKQCNLVFTYKYKIKSPYLNHPLELFYIKYDDFFAKVSQFHLPCVRAYYTNTNVYMNTSCVIAHMTFMNIDYKYFTGTKDPFYTFNTYGMRGYGTWLNEKLKKQHAQYCKNVPFWSNLYSLSPESDDTTQIFGVKMLNHKLFHPRMYNIDDYTECNYVDTVDRYKNTELPGPLNGNFSTSTIIQSTFKTIKFDDINYDTFKAIDTTGMVVPVKKYIIEYTWDNYITMSKKPLKPLYFNIVNKNKNKNNK